MNISVEMECSYAYISDLFNRQCPVIFPDFVLSCDAEYKNICHPPSAEGSQWDVITFMKPF